MGSYGRNFDFRSMPTGAGRGARYYLGGSNNIPIGAPVAYDSGTTTASFGNGVLGVVLASGAQAPKLGFTGIAVYEHAPAAYAGFDPYLTTFSDIDFVPHGKMCQVVNGTNVKVVFTNTVANTFLQTRSYAGRIMVQGVGTATTGPAIGDYLTPSTGNDTDGYWETTAVSADRWLVITAVDHVGRETEAKMLF